MPGTLSFPPLLPSSQWKGAKQAAPFPGAAHTWKAALKPRPLHHTPSRETVSEIKLATESRFNTLQETLQLPNYSETPSGGGVHVRPTANAHNKKKNGPLYDTVWPGTTAPDFSVWDYCKKVGHAPPSVPAPRVNDMKSWFATYGHPQLPPAGVRSECVNLQESNYCSLSARDDARVYCVLACLLMGCK